MSVEVLSGGFCPAQVEQFHRTMLAGRHEMLVSDRWFIVHAHLGDGDAASLLPEGVLAVPALRRPALHDRLYSGLTRRRLVRC